LAWSNRRALKVSGARKRTPESQGQTGSFEKMICEAGTVSMDLELNRLNGSPLTPQKPVALQFTVAANSFFSVLVFNDSLRGAEQGSMTLVSETVIDAPGYSQLPVLLAASIKQLTVEKLAASDQFDWAVRDA